MSNQQIEQPIEVLRKVLARWPKKPLTVPYDQKALGDLRAKIGSYVTDEFDYAIFLIKENGSSSTISEGYVEGKLAKFLTYRHKNDLPLLAVLVQQQDGTWKLDILSFQCTSCFGEGVD